MISTIELQEDVNIEQPKYEKSPKLYFNLQTRNISSFIQSDTSSPKKQQHTPTAIDNQKKIQVRM